MSGAGRARPDEIELSEMRPDVLMRVRQDYPVLWVSLGILLSDEGMILNGRYVPYFGPEVAVASYAGIGVQNLQSSSPSWSNNSPIAANSLGSQVWSIHDSGPTLSPHFLQYLMKYPGLGGVNEGLAVRRILYN